nr:beta-ketoacyl synthase N-terminal-like domain-containing protein [Micromonospora sp. DSM 115978]
VIMGHVIQAGGGQITARQAAVKGGIPMGVPSITINKVCLSGLDAIALADTYISTGEYDVIVAGGMESMTNGPHLLPSLRGGVKYGNAELLDATAYDALTDVFDHVAMGLSTERSITGLGISRADQDEFSA